GGNLHTTQGSCRLRQQGDCRQEDLAVAERDTQLAQVPFGEISCCTNVDVVSAESLDILADAKPAEPLCYVVRHPPTASACLWPLCRSNILIDPEQVVGIILALHCNKALKIAAVGCADARVAFVTHHKVNVTAAHRERVDGLPIGPAPSASDVRPWPDRDQ